MQPCDMLGLQMERVLRRLGYLIVTDSDVMTPKRADS